MKKLMKWLSMLMWSIVCIGGGITAFFTYHDVLALVLMIIWIFAITNLYGWEYEEL